MFVTGDVDANGAFNAHDLIALKKQMKFGITTELFRVDINGDQKFNAHDLLALAKLLKEI